MPDYLVMRRLLEEMIAATKDHDLEKLTELNFAFEPHFSPLNQRRLGEIHYDNCRQSCFMAFIFPNMYKDALKDAEERFLRLPD